jgi:hypothetical protein
MPLQKTSALVMALALGLITPASAEEWSGLHLTFGLRACPTKADPGFVERQATAKTLEAVRCFY